jgi:hypothetical protein
MLPRDERGCARNSRPVSDIAGWEQWRESFVGLPPESRRQAERIYRKSHGLPEPSATFHQVLLGPEDRIAILTPTWYKGQGLIRFVRSVYATTTRADVFVYCAADDPDLAAITAVVGTEKLTVGPPSSFVAAVNHLWKAHPGYRYYMWGSDDTEMLDNKWAETLITAIQQDADQYGIAWLNDEIGDPSRLPRHPCVSALFLKTLGYFTLPALDHYGCDDVLNDLATALGRRRFISDVHMKHHRDAGVRVTRVGYDHGKDISTYYRWREQQYETDLARLKTLRTLQAAPATNATGTTFSVIVPTTGRLTLSWTLKSLMSQTQVGDEIIVVGDGSRPATRDLCMMYQRGGAPIKYSELSVGTSHCGAAQRDLAISIATGKWLTFMDDDDIYTRGALGVMRTALPMTPDKPHIFRMQYNDRSGRVLWDVKQFRICNLGTPMMVVPNRPGLPKWMRPATTACFDWFWIEKVMSLYPTQQVAWHEDIIAMIRPTDACLIEEIL